MKLSILLKALESMEPFGTGITGGYDPDVTSIHYRADSVMPGGLFFAIKGHVADGHDFIDEALSRGAVAIVSEKPVKENSTVFCVKNARKAMALISARFYNNPSKKMSLICITGTNGKTTTAYLIESILEKEGIKAGVIGTVNYRYGKKVFANLMTTPESMDLQRILSEMVENNITHCVLEVSSHAIDLNRIDGCHIDVGVFTNLSQDHLDYHGDMESYWACKKKMFSKDYLCAGFKKACAVINCEDDKGKELFDMLSCRKISTGFSKENTVSASMCEFNLGGIKSAVLMPESEFKLKSPLVGKHNLENILSAVGAANALGISDAVIKSGILEFAGVPGRLQTVRNNLGRSVFVDYAHTPDALENVLLTLKSITEERVICVFGCGGDRDNTKRPLMGEISARLSDLSVITSDNPRTEEPVNIIEQIVSGTRKVISNEYKPSGLKKGFSAKGFVVEPDRRKALRLGISASNPCDAVLIAGKGHETYQIIGKQKFDFNDVKEAQNFMATLEPQTVVA